jgi:hypothetical protein
MAFLDGLIDERGEILGIARVMPSALFVSFAPVPG